MDNQRLDFKHYVIIFKKRIKLFIIPSLLITLATILLAVLLPSVYKSSATILLEEQELPADLLIPPATRYAEQRVQIFIQQITTLPNFSDIIKKNSLYTKDQKNKTLENILDKIRERISVELMSATERTITFTLSFEDESPEVAKTIANELSTLFLNEKIKSRTLRAENEILSFREYSKKLKKDTQKILNKLAVFKQKNLSSLPGLTPLNQQKITALNSRLLTLDSEERSLQEWFFYLQGQLAQVAPNAMVTNAEGNRIFDTKGLLNVLESQYPSLLATYSAMHPDVLAAKREITSLKLLIGQNSVVNAELSEKKAEYTSILKRYSKNHPEVLALDMQVKRIQASMLKAKKLAASQPKLELNTPAYITMLTELETVSIELKSVKYTRNMISNKIAKLIAIIRKAPLVEKEYIDLLKELDNANKRYREVSARVMEMEVESSQHSEIEIKGNRFTLISPPQEPLIPDSPNRPAILFFGFVLAIGTGIALVVVKEAISKNQRNGTLTM